MLQQFRLRLFTQIVWGILAIHFINISIDAPDFYPNHIPENLSYNEQESIVELVTETLLGYDDVFEEYDDDDSEDFTVKKNLHNIWYCVAPSPIKVRNKSGFTAKPKFFYHLIGNDHLAISINSPPPEV